MLHSGEKLGGWCIIMQGTWTLFGPMRPSSWMKWQWAAYLHWSVPFMKHDMAENRFFFSGPFDICYLVFFYIYRTTGCMITSRIELVHQTCQLNIQNRQRERRASSSQNGTQISSHMLMDSHSNCVDKARGRQYVNDAHVVFYFIA